MILAFPAQAQKYWVFLKDKDVSAYDYRKHLSEQTIKNRLLLKLDLQQNTDIPINQVYLEAIKAQNVQIIHQSKWLNAVSAVLNNSQIEALKKLPFVEKIQKMGNTKILSLPKTNKKNYDLALKQMKAEVFADSALNGKGILIGVIDGGFYGADSDFSLEHLFKEKKILGIKDWVNPKKTDHFSEFGSETHNHGTTVLSMITGYTELSQTGLATQAKFYLARSENSDREYRQEEDYWVLAMEWLDSLGVRIINTSLGYANGFDDPAENYKPEQMNGQTSVISKAAQIAYSEKGILVVVAAGNEGSDAWRIISAPADAKGALSVGATNMFKTKIYYSSIGTDFLPYLKPNISCYSENGTSFSAPMIAGFAACLLQSKPNAQNSELFDAIEKSANLYPFGNYFIGYGIPNAPKALEILYGNIPKNQIQKEVKAKKEYFLAEKIKKGSQIIVFHKKNERTVISQDYFSFNPKKQQILQPAGVLKTTLAWEGGVIEIVWE